MSDVPTPRIIKETNNLKVEAIPGIQCEVDPQNFRHFFVKIEGLCLNILRTLNDML